MVWIPSDKTSFSIFVFSLKTPSRILVTGNPSNVPGTVSSFVTFLTFERASLSPNFTNWKYSFSIGSTVGIELDEELLLEDETEELVDSLGEETLLEEVSGLCEQEVMRREAAIRNIRLRCMGSPLRIKSNTEMIGHFGV